MYTKKVHSKILWLQDVLLKIPPSFFCFCFFLVFFNFFYLLCFFRYHHSQHCNTTKSCKYCHRPQSQENPFRARYSTSCPTCGHIITDETRSCTWADYDRYDFMIILLSMSFLKTWISLLVTLFGWKSRD